MSAPVTLAGRFTKDPELKYSAKGKAFSTFTVVTSERWKDDQTQEWKERNTTFWDCVAFGDLAENICESLEKGTAVIVTGRAYQEKWQAKDGTNRYSLKVTADDVAPSMRWDRVTVRKSDRQKPGQQAGPADDPWSGERSSFTDEPPF